MKKILSTLLILVLSVTCARASMMDDGSWGVGYQAGYTGDLLQGISARSWYGNNGYEFNGYVAYAKYDVNDDSGNIKLFEFEGKYMRSLVVNKNSRFYVGVGVGYGRLDGSIEDEDEDESEHMDTILAKPLFGAEFMFTEIPELGFNFEVSYGFSFWDIDDVDITLSSLAVGFGIHYYF